MCYSKQWQANRVPYELLIVFKPHCLTFKSNYATKMKLACVWIPNGSTNLAGRHNFSTSRANSVWDFNFFFPFRFIICVEERIFSFSFNLVSRISRAVKIPEEIFSDSKHGGYNISLSMLSEKYEGKKIFLILPIKQIACCANHSVSGFILRYWITISFVTLPATINFVTLPTTRLETKEYVRRLCFESRLTMNS